MKWLISLLLLATVAFAKIKEEGGVLVLTEKTFEEAISKYGEDGLLVKFYAPWCGHCKKMAPEYEKAAKKLKANNIRIAKVDATQEKELAERFDIGGFPTLKFFRGGKPSEYTGGRDAASIVAWVSKRTGPATATVASAEELKTLQAAHEVVVLGFGASVQKLVEEVALASSDETGFGSSSSDEVRAAVGLAAGAEAIVLLADFEGEEKVRTFAGDASSAEALSAWVAANSLPAVVTFSQEVAPKIFRGDIKSHFLLFAAEAGEEASASASAAALAGFRAVAVARRAEAAAEPLLFVHVPPSEDRVLSYFGITEADLPTAVLVNMAAGGMKKFKFAAPYAADEQGFRSFAEAYFAGSLKPFLKSEEPVPAAENAAGDVWRVVGSAFEADVLQFPGAALVSITAPWCGHCKALKPTYAQLGKAVKAAGLAGSALRIGDMDGTANEIDVEGVEVRGFPTIYFFPAGAAKEPVAYDGSRDLSGFVAFLQENMKGEGAAEALAKLQEAVKGLGGSEEEEEGEEEDEE